MNADDTDRNWEIGKAKFTADDRGYTRIFLPDYGDYGDSFDGLNGHSLNFTHLQIRRRRRFKAAIEQNFRY